MARIDRFIQVLFERSADQIVFAPGEKVALRSDDRARSVTASPLDAKLLGAFLREIAPPELAHAVEHDGEHRFAYDAPSGGVSVLVRRGADGVRLEVTPGEMKRESVMRDPDESASAARDPTAVAGAIAPNSVVSGAHTAAMDALFGEMCRQGCSDLHLSSGCPPLVRKDGLMGPLSSSEALGASRVREMLYSITPPRRRVEFEQRSDTDFSYELPGIGRFRCNLLMDRKGMGGVFRVIPSDIPTAEDLGLSSTILKLCHLKKGLVVVTGPTGSGKSTTLTAMVDHINRNRSVHIITIEDPIEFVHENKKALINQREIGNHTEGFKTALRAALREDPDIVLVGEMRDLETVQIAIETAETGHLVLGTLHTNTAASTVDRIIDQFPTDRQAQVRTMLAGSLKGVIAQSLCRKKGGGRVAAMEILIVNHAVGNLIREGKTFQIPSLMQTGKRLGMVTLNDALLDLVVKGQVEPKDALLQAVEQAEFAKLLASKGMGLDVDGQPE